MEHFFDNFDPRSREKGNNWKLGLRFPPPPGNIFPSRNPIIRNNEFSRLPRDNYPFHEQQRCRNFERYHYYNPVRHRMFLPPHPPRFDNIRKNYKEPYRGPITPNHQNYFAFEHIGVQEHNFSPPGQRNISDFESNFSHLTDDFRNSPSTSRSNVFNETNVTPVTSSTEEKNLEKKTSLFNPEAAKKEALAAELRKSLQKFQKTHSQSGSKLRILDKSNESNKAESTCEPQTCFPWDLPLTVDDLKSIGRGKTGNIEACADSCSENELNMLEKQNTFQHTEKRGESTNESSPEIQIIEQVRKRKVSESIDLENKKKKPNSFRTRRRHRSASPTLCEEVEAENVEKSKEDKSGPIASEKESRPSHTKSPKIDISRKSRHKPSLMELLGVRRREFSEMVDQPRNPKVQFMLNLLMKRHKELLSHRALRSRFSAVNGKVKVGSNQKEKESDTVLTETQNSAGSTLQSKRASDAIDELTNILLESSLTVDISSLPQELIEQLGNFLEMGVDLGSLSDEITIADELASDSSREIEDTQHQVDQHNNKQQDSRNLTDLLPEDDLVLRLSESSDTENRQDIPEHSRKKGVSCKKMQNSSPEKTSPNAKRRNKVPEETKRRKEKVVHYNSCNVVPAEKNRVNECYQQLHKSKDDLHHSKSLIGDEREARNIGSIKIESVTIPSESETGVINSVELSESDDLPSEKSHEKEVMDSSIVIARTEDCVSQNSPFSSLPLVSSSEPKDEDETEEKLISKMWDIDMEIGKLMDKKQQLYHKLTQLRSLRQNFQSVSISKDNHKSVQKSGTKQPESINTEVNVDRVSGENSEEIPIISQPSSSDNHSTPSQVENSKICVSAEPEQIVKLTVQLSGSGRTVNISDVGNNSLNEVQPVEMPNKKANAGHLCQVRNENNTGNERKINQRKNEENTEPCIITGRAMYQTEQKETVLAIKVHKNYLYAACANFSVYCYKLSSMKIEMEYTGHTNTVTSIHISIDNHGGSKLFSGSHDQTMLMFSARSGKLIQAFNVEEKITCIEECWGILYIGTKEGNILRFNILKSAFTEQKLPGLKSEVMAIQASKEGPRKVLIVALRDKPIIVRDASTGLLLRSINESTEKHIVYAIHAIHGLVYAGSSLYGLTAWDFTNGKRVHQYEGCGSIVAVHVVNQKIYAASYDGNIYLYDCANSKPEHIIRASEKMLLCLAVRHSKIYAGSLDKKLQIWRSPYRT